MKIQINLIRYLNLFYSDKIEWCQDVQIYRQSSDKVQTSVTFGKVVGHNMSRILKILLLFDPVINLLRIYPKKITWNIQSPLTCKDIYYNVSLMVRNRKQPKHSTEGGWVTSYIPKCLKNA